MDLVLVSITGLSLALAVGLGVVVFRLLNEERRRSNARVALLSAAAAAEDTGGARREPAPGTPVRLFCPSDSPFAWGRRTAAAAGCALVAVLLFAVLFTGGEGRDTQAGTRGDSPLELSMLQHTRQPDGLTITGTVRNPEGAAPLTGVTAAAHVFGGDGALLATGRGRLPATVLAPGSEAPFVIQVPIASDVSRYRVGFRRSDGSSVAHVDRRASVASSGRAPGSGS